MLLCALTLLALLPTCTPAILPRALHALPYSAITPSGWLRAELSVQASGLSGAFPDSWAPVNAALHSYYGAPAEAWLALSVPRAAGAAAARHGLSVAGAGAP